jgi:hypothetical protein
MVLPSGLNRIDNFKEDFFIDRGYLDRDSSGHEIQLGIT